MARQAQDLTQEFFTRVLEGRYLDRGDPEKGRFRSFLSSSPRVRACGAGNNGTHIGLLYSSSGTLLAQGTFTGETTSGWQKVMLSQETQRILIAALETIRHASGLLGVAQLLEDFLRLESQSVRGNIQRGKAQQTQSALYDGDGGQGDQNTDKTSDRDPRAVTGRTILAYMPDAVQSAPRIVRATCIERTRLTAALRAASEELQRALRLHSMVASDHDLALFNKVDAALVPVEQRYTDAVEAFRRHVEVHGCAAAKRC